MKRSRLWMLTLLIMVFTLCCVTAVACAGNSDPATTTKEEGPETGVYYYDTSLGEEYLVTLSGGDYVTFNFGSTLNMSATYELDEDGVFTFSVNVDSLSSTVKLITATYSNDVITLVYNGGAEMRFLRKTYYTVTFNSNGGSAVDSVSVVNGRTVAKPDDPVLSGYVFIGWYTDSTYSATFSFGSAIIEGDTTLYARWAATVAGADEFEVSFDLNYSGAASLDAVETVGGQIYNVTTPERSGYTFCGWWISQYDSADKLSFLYEEGYVFTENATLYALWAETSSSKLATPVVNVTSNTISWEAVGNVLNYTLKIYDGDTCVFSDDVSATTYVYQSLAVTGEYRIEVTANSSAGESYNSDTAVRYYATNMLSRVSLFTVVEPAVLVFNSVSGATRYYITVSCGNEQHSHRYVDNGSSVYYDFSNCDMQEGGITFTVTATGDNYVSSVSRVYAYSRDLDEVTGYDYDSDTATLVWDAVENATSYVVTVSIDDEEVYSDNIGAVRSFSLKEYSGNITVSIYAKTRGYNSGKATTYSVSKASLATPSDVKITGTVVSWAAVEGATGYELTIGSVTLTTEETSYDVAEALEWITDTDYTLTIRATSASANSLWSDGLDVRYLGLYSTLTYDRNTVTWRPVVGAAYYVVSVNGGAATTVSDGSYSLAVTLTQAGVNTISVQFYDGELSEAATIEVYAYTITYNSNGGTSVAAQYYAIGDKITYPDEPTKSGYNFSAWYTTPSGADSNGLRYSEEYFNESTELVLYAYYLSKEYTVVYYFDSTGSGSVDSSVVYYNQSYKLIVPTTSDETKSFGGWFSAIDGAGTQYTDSEGNSLAVWSLTEENYATNSEGESLGYFIVYAFWQDNTLSFSLTKVSGVTAYAVSAGSKITSVSSVTIPTTYRGVTVAMIAGSAFKDCTTLVTINIPETIQLVSSSDPFSGCTNLVNVKVYPVDGNNLIRYENGLNESGESDGVLYDRGELQDKTQDPVASDLTLVYFPAGRTGSYTIPDNVSTIPTSSFASCKLTTIVIPSTVKTIGATAFSNSSNLANVTFEVDTIGEASLTIGSRAFYNCDALKSITLPAHLTSIAYTKYTISSSALGTPGTYTVSYSQGQNTTISYAFAGCDNLTAIYVESGNSNYTSSDDGTLLMNANTSGYTIYSALYSISGNIDLTNIQVGNSTVTIKEIGAGAFIYCKDITSLTVSPTVTSIGECAFYLSRVSSVTFKGSSVSDLSIGRYAFRSCTRLTSVTFDEKSKVTSMGVGAFYGTALTTITLPSTLSTVSEQAFRECTELASVYIEGNVDDTYTLSFGEDAFYGCTKLTYFYLPANVSEISGMFSGCTNLAKVEVDTANPYIVSDGSVLYAYEKDGNNFVYKDKDGNDSDADNGYKVVNEITYMTVGTETYEIPVGLTEISVTDSTDTTTTFNVYFEIATIGVEVLKGLTKLTEITIPSTVTSIGDNAFENCTALTTVNFADGTLDLEFGDYVFAGCTSLTELELPSRTKSFGQKIIDGCSSLTSLVLNEGLTEIPDSAFDGCGSGTIAEVVIPSTVKTIGAYAFQYCTGIQTITFARDEDNNTALTTIGYNAFAFMHITSISIPATVVEIGYGAFQAGFDHAETGYLESVTFEKYTDGTCSLTTIMHYAFAHQLITSVDIPKSVTYIGSNAFTYCENLATLTFEAGGTKALEIGTAMYYLDPTTGSYKYDDSSSRTFAYCYSLTSVTLPARVSAICDYAFYYCTSLKEVSFEAETDGTGAVVYDNDGVPKFLEGVSSSYAYIGAYAFQYCTNLTTVYIPSYITNTDGSDAEARYGIGTYAFADDTSLKTVIFATGSELPLSFGDYAFYNCSALTELNLPGRLATYDNHMAFAADDVFTGCTALAAINIASDITSPEYASVDGIVYDADKAILIYCPVAKTGEVEIPYTVTTIYENAFYNCTGITAVTFEKSTEDINGTTASDSTNALAIGDNAFYGCTGLTVITFPTRLTSIGATAFAECANLEEITLSKNLTSFSASMFLNCNKLQKIDVESGSSTYSSDDDGVLFNKAGDTLILYLSTKADTSYTVPDGVQTIDDNAFSGNSYLESVTLSSSVVKIGASAFSDCVSLKSVYLASVTSIGASAFYGCVSLKSVNIPTSVTEIGVLAFYNCTALETVTFDAGGSSDLTIGNSTTTTSATTTTANETNMAADAVTYAVFGNTTSLTTVTFPERTTVIGTYAFYNSGVKSVYIPSTVTTIGTAAFYNASKLLTVEFGYDTEGTSSLTTLPAFAFRNCTSLQSIEIPDSVTTLGSYVFYMCWNMKSITLSSSLKEIPQYGFQYCSSLTELEIPASVALKPSSNYGTGSAPFKETYSLKTITISEKTTSTAIGQYFFYYATGLENIVIPNSIKTINQYAFYGCTSLESVTLPTNDSFTAINTGTFRDCSSLKSIKIPSSVTTIGQRAFQGCSSLTSIVLPDSVKTLNTYAFYECTSLESVTLPDNSSFTTIPAQIFYGCSSLTDIEIPETVTTINASAFSYCTSLKSIVIPDSVTSMTAIQIFYGCTSLESVTLPSNSSYTTIASSTFRDCTSLKNIVIPDYVTTINAYAFWNCTSLESIDLNNVTTLPNTGNNVTNSPGAFAGCTSLKSVNLSKCTSLGNYTFYNCTSLTDIEIPSTVTTLGMGVFMNCSSLTNVEIPETVTSVNTNNLFYGCSSLQTVSLPSSITTFTSTSATSGTFYNCSSLTNVEIPETVTSIGLSVFFNCKSLTSIVIPDSVTSIGTSAFSGCTGLESVTLPTNDSFTAINGSTFRNCSSLTSIVIPSSVTSIGATAFYGCSSLVSIDLSAVTTLTAGTNATSALFGECASLESVTLPASSSYTAIGAYTFYNCSALTGIEIPSYVTSIDAYAFYGCSSLGNVSIPNTVTSIGDNAFRGCTSFTSVVIPESVTTIGTYAFADCTSLETATLPANSSYTTLDEYTFYNCTALTEISIPESVTVIGDYALANCSSLVEINIPFNVTSLSALSFMCCTSLTTFVTDEASVEYTATDNGVTLTNSDGAIVAYANGVIDSYTVTASSLADYAFAGATFEEVTISSDVTLGKYIFYGATADTVTLSGTVTEVSAYMFYGAGSIDTVVLPETVTAIGDYAFYNVSITGITLPQSLTTIGASAFYGCTLTSIVIPKSVTSIGNSAFAYTGDITITFEEGGTEILTIGANAFYYSGITSIQLPARLRGYATGTSYVYALGSYAFSRSSIQTVTFEDGSAFTSEYFFNMESYAFDGCTNLVSITLPSYLGDLTYVNSSEEIVSVAAIGDYAFNGCTSLETVTLPANDNYSSLGNNMFYNCTSLTSIVIPDNVTSIGDYSFYGCTALTSIDLNKVTTMGKLAFSGCTSLVSVDLGEVTAIPSGTYSSSAGATGAFVNCIALETVTMSNCTSIGDYTFYGCTALKTVVLNDGLESIGSGAFGNCTSIENITIPASVTTLGSVATAAVTASTQLDYQVFANWTSSQTITITSTESTYTWCPSWSWCSANIVYLDQTV